MTGGSVAGGVVVVVDVEVVEVVAGGEVVVVDVGELVDAVVAWLAPFSPPQAASPISAIAIATATFRGRAFSRGSCLSLMRFSDRSGSLLVVGHFGPQVSLAGSCG
jgi:hypothetical protein